MPADALLPFVAVLAAACVVAVYGAAVLRARSGRRTRANAGVASAAPKAEALTLPDVVGVAFSERRLPGTAGAADGGAWHDIVPLADGRLAIASGDTVGGGPDATNRIRDALRDAAAVTTDPGAILAAANRRLIAAEPSFMATALVAILCPTTLVCVYASAGHPAPIVTAPDDEPRLLRGDAPPLGLFPVHRARVRTVLLPPGAVLLLATSGAVARTRDVVHGRAELVRALGAELHAPTADPAATVAASVAGAGHRTDDAALLVVRLAAAIPSFAMTFPALAESAAEARSAFQRFIASLGIDERTAFGLLLATGEATASAIEHAYDAEAAHPSFTVRGYREGTRAIFEIADAGRRSASAAPGRGGGLPLMRALADTVEVRDGENGTLVRIAKELGR